MTQPHTETCNADEALDGEVLDRQASMIIVSDPEHVQVTQAVAALARSRNLYQRGGVIVGIARDLASDAGVSRPAGTPRIALARHARVREELSHCADFARETKAGLRAAHVPKWLPDMVLARGEWETLHRLEAVIEFPIVRPDGSVATREGYDRDTGVYCAPSVDIEPLPEAISRDMAVAAAAELLEIVVDFPFAGAADRSAWLAGLLTPLARHAFAGPAPMLVIDANVRGTGKTMLVQLIAQVTTGQSIPRMAQTSSDEEERKRILSIAIASDPLILIDNVEGTFGGPAIDAALTSTMWRDRILGASSMVSVPLTTTWYLSANNASMRGDTSRRVMHARLLSREERPEERTDLRRPDLLAWVGRHRAPLLRRALIILSGFLRAGAPPQALTPWGSYESWSALVRGAVVWAGLRDPAETRQRVAEALDTDGDLLDDLLTGLAGFDSGGGGVTMRRVCEVLVSQPGQFADLRAALLELAPSATHALDPRRIANRLKKFRERVRSGRMLVALPKSADGVRWVVRRVAGGDAGDASDAADERSPTDGGACSIPTAARSTVTSVTESAASLGEDQERPATQANGGDDDH